MDNLDHHFLGINFPFPTGKFFPYSQTKSCHFTLLSKNAKDAENADLFLTETEQ